MLKLRRSSNCFSLILTQWVLPFLFVFYFARRTLEILFLFNFSNTVVKPRLLSLGTAFLSMRTTLGSHIWLEREPTTQFPSIQEGWFFSLWVKLEIFSLTLSLPLCRPLKPRENSFFPTPPWFVRIHDPSALRLSIAGWGSTCWLASPQGEACRSCSLAHRLLTIYSVERRATQHLPPPIHSFTNSNFPLPRSPNHRPPLVG